jgi:hypothetical protein
VLPNGRRAAAWWFGSRAVIFGLWAAFGLHSQGDIRYYWENIDALFHGQSAAATMPEYPTPLLAVLTVPYVLGFGELMGFRIAFIGLFILTDALMTLGLWKTARRYGTNPAPTVGFWLAFIIAIGPISYMRLDLLTAVLSAAALITLLRQQRVVSGAMIGGGAALKLWPALLWPASLVDRKAVFRATAGFLGAGAALAGISWWAAGWDRLISPLTWQSDRGLQIESIWATPAMVARLFSQLFTQTTYQVSVSGNAYQATVSENAYSVAVSQYNAFEIHGPGTDLFTSLSSVATLAGGLTMLALYIGWLRRRQRTPIEAGTLMIIATLIMIVTNKTFSPQYMIWLGGPVAGLLTISARNPDTGLTGANVTPLHLARQIALWTLSLTVLTQLIYPICYDWLIFWQGGLTVIATLLLALRNVLICYFTVRLILFARRSIVSRQSLEISP